MKKLLTAAICAACITGGVLLRASALDGASGGGKATFKVVIHVNFDDADQQEHGLKNVANMLAGVGGVGEGDIEVVCHGKGIGLLVKDKTKLSEPVAKLMKSGVRFAACENTMREKSIAKEDLLPGVVTVPSGAVEVIRKQQEGYGYFKP